MKRIAGLGIVCLTLLLAISVEFWNKGTLGFFVHPTTQKVVYITPELSLTGTDLRVDDTIIQVYHRDWQELLREWNFFRLIPPPDQSIPITIERNGAIHHIQLYQYPQTRSQYFDKLVNLFLAMTCIATGYILAKRAYYEGVIPRGIGFFWFGVGLVVGLHNFAGQASLPLLVTLEWIMLSMYIPYFVVAHTFFPYRFSSPSAIADSERRLLVMFVITNALTVAVVRGVHMSLIDFVTYMNPLMTVGIFIAFFGSTIFLYHTYRATTINHMRRQIRIILSAYGIVMSLWFILLTLPSLISNTPLPSQFINLITIVIPITYLVSGIFPDLYSIDRIIRRGLSYLLTLSILVIGARLTLYLLKLQSENIPIWTALYGIVLYVPILNLIRRSIPALRIVNSYQPLYEASHLLTTTLDRSQLITSLANGIDHSFQHPAMSIYVRTSLDDPQMHLVHNQRMPYIPVNFVIEADEVAQSTTIKTSAELRSISFDSSPHHDLQSLVHHPQISLWCPIYHSQYHLLGIIVLGRRDDQDPYRLNDIYELQRLLNATALALAHSGLYDQQVESQQTIRLLFKQVQQIQDKTAQSIAREIHDEIINISIRLNIESIQKLIARTNDPELLRQLDLVLMSEKDMAHTLRLICESLHPSGIDDPYGFTAILTNQIDQLRILFHGSLYLHIQHTLCPIEPVIQHELVRITKEAVVNAITHANADTITITLRYPRESDHTLSLTVEDNGSEVPTMKKGHFGIRNMQERALMMDGTFSMTYERGTSINVTVPLPYESFVENHI